MAAGFEDQLAILRVLGGKDGEKFTQKFKDRDAALQKFGQKIPDRYVWSGRCEEMRYRMQSLARSSASFCHKVPGFAKELERKYDELRKNDPNKFAHRVSLEKTIKERMDRVYWFDEADLGTRIMPGFTAYRDIDGKSTPFPVPEVRDGNEWECWKKQVGEMSEILLEVVNHVVLLGYHFPHEVINFVNSFDPSFSEYSIHASTSTIYDLIRARIEPGAIHKVDDANESSGETKVSDSNVHARAIAKIIFDMTAQIDATRKSVESLEASFRLAPQKFESVLELVNIKKQNEALTALVEALNRTQ